MFPRPNTHDIVDRQDKNFPIADTPRVSRRHNGIDNIIYLVFWSKDFELRLGQKINHILRTPVQFCMPLLASEAFNLGHRQSLDTNSTETILDFIEFERLDDGLNLFHSIPHSSPPCTRPRLLS